MSSGSGEILKSSVRQGCSPKARQIRCTLVGEIPTRLASSRLDQCVAPSGTSSRVRTTTSSTWASVIVRGTPGPGLVAQPVQPAGQEPGPPLPDGGPADAQPRGHGDIGPAVRAGQHDPRPQRQPLRGLPPLRPVLQRPPLGLRQHQRLQPRITHATSRPRTEAPSPPGCGLRRNTTHVVKEELKTGTLAYGDHLKEAGSLARRAQDAAAAAGAPSSLAIASWAMGEITAATDPGQARQHLQQAVDLATPVGSRLVVALAEVSLATLHARHGDPATALRYYQRVIPQWRQAGAWTPQWVTIRTLIDLLTRVGACRDAATLYGAATAATTGAPPYGADADRLRRSAAQLRDKLTATDFRTCAEEGERLESHRVIDLALDAIARATSLT